MQQIKNILKKYFTTLAYFYSHLRYRLVIIFIMSLLVGLMDGLGLTMFIPLLETIANNGAAHNSEQLGKLAFITEGMGTIGLSLTLTNILLVMLFFFIVKGIFKFLEQYIGVIYRQFFIRNLRIDSVNSLAKINYEYFIKEDAGRIQNTVTGEVGRVVQGFNTYISILQQFVLLLVYAGLALIANPQFALLVSVGALLTNLIFNKLYKITKKLSVHLTQHNHGLQGLIIQQVAQFKYLKATGTIYEYTNKIIHKILQIEKTQRKMGFIGATTSGLREPIIMLLVIISILIQVKYMGASLGSIILSILFFYRALSSIMTIQTSWNKYLELSGSFENLKNFMNELNAHKETTGKKEYTNFKTHLELKEVVFGYDAQPILKNINLSIQKNETIALVGESGSGKTTLVNLVTGLLKPSQGKYLIDNIPVAELDILTFQQQIGYITQEPVIFNDTIFNNVTFWAEKNRENIDRFHQALLGANVLDFIKELPLQEESLLGNNGINVSGGQKQRLSIARELYKGAKIILLDEATSALDTETEKRIQESFEQLQGHYTLIIIAHRLSTVKNADRIVVLSKGEIENIGTFEELLHTSEIFKRMVALQHL